MMTYAFTFDASACSGCKACQIACKDKHNLPIGVLWRRVYEVSGGSWQKHDQAWTTDVFAYNLSMACNHCAHPKCAGVCPTDAYVQREDGIVYIDEAKCMGCGYCSWACPYSAPRYHHELRHMTKCDLCHDNLDAGLPPACVAACPMRVLELIEINGQAEDGGGVALWKIQGSEHPFPLPEGSRTEPHLTINQHTGMENGLDKSIWNQEEIKAIASKSELPLVAFTLFGQAAAGVAMLSLIQRPLSLLFLFVVGVLIGVAGLISVLHLGTPLNAWRALLHLKKSWLSREILFFAFFGLSWLLCLFLPGMGKLPLAISGAGFVYSMAQVYRLRSIPAWDSWRTNAGFFVTALLLGKVLMLILIPNARSWDLSFLLALQFFLLIMSKGNASQPLNKIRLGLILTGIVTGLAFLALPIPLETWIMIPIVLIVLGEETLGRWIFYDALNRRPL